MSARRRLRWFLATRLVLLACLWGTLLPVGAITPPSRAEGEASLATAAAVMKELCKTCCQTSSGSDCSPEQCQLEADAIMAAVIRTWNDNYGKGSNTSSDNVGGYLCWDWAKKFADAAASTRPKCWTVSTAMANKAGSRAVHYWVDMYACQKTDECLVILDDGWFHAGKLVHRPPWPGHPDWTRGGLPLPPAGRTLTPEKKESGIDDWGALTTIAVAAAMVIGLFFARRPRVRTT